MPITCPKCQHVRPADTRAPDWQCPACGVAYVKAAEAAEAARRPHAARPVIYQARPEPATSWRKWVAVLAMAAGAWFGIRHATGHASDADVGESPAVAAVSGQGLRDLASDVKAGDVVIYTTSWCGYCAQAKRWMRENGFAFTECDVEADARCASEFQATGSQGVPILRVRGEWMDGFDSDKFVALLQQ